KDEFLNNNHIQANDKSNLYFGLFYSDQLVAVMTFTKDGVINNYGVEKNGIFELSRYSTLLNHSIVDEFSKLLKHDVKIISDEYKDSMIYTYVDKNISRRNLYNKNGIKYIRDTKPSYFYINKNTEERIHRYTFRKGNLKNLFPDHYKSDLTEFQIMNNVNEYLRVYDSGNMYFEYKMKEVIDDDD